MSSETNSSFQIKRLNPYFGAEISGIDLSSDLDEETFSKIRDAYYEYSLLVFHDQRIAPKVHVDFSKRFGSLEIHSLKQYLLEDHPEILLLSNIIENGKPIGFADTERVATWHTDTSYLKTPSAGSALYALEVPYDSKGNSLGNTLFASTFAAYDALSEDMKIKLRDLKALHKMTKAYDDAPKDTITAVKFTDEQINRPPENHPIIRTHPVTGRKSIYLSPLCVTKIEGIPEAESKKILQELDKLCTREDFVYRHKWKANDLIMWDNCSTQHLAVSDYAPPLRRKMHRTTFAGSIPF